MAQLRERADQPDLRVIRGRGRPPKGYPKYDGALAPGSIDWMRLARKHQETVVRDGWRPEALPTTWYMPADDEELGDSLTIAWLYEYRALHRDDWKRMRQKTKRYSFWTAKTARKRKAQEDAAIKRFLAIYSTSSKGVTRITECLAGIALRVTCATCHYAFLTAGNSRYCSMSCNPDYKTN